MASSSTRKSLLSSISSAPHAATPLLIGTPTLVSYDKKPSPSDKSTSEKSKTTPFASALCSDLNKGHSESDRRLPSPAGTPPSLLSSYAAIQQDLGGTKPIDMKETKSPLVTPPTQPKIEIKSVEDIRKYGKSLGSGAFGTAYRIKNTVFKVYRDSVFYVPQKYVENSVYFWNYCYLNMYNGAYKDLATATFVNMPESSTSPAKTAQVLVTPYIEASESGEKFCFCWCPSMSDRYFLQKEFYKIGLAMADDDVQGNLKKDKKTGRVLPVDFDQVNLSLHTFIHSYASLKEDKSEIHKTGSSLEEVNRRLN